MYRQRDLALFPFSAGIVILTPRLGSSTLDGTIHTYEGPSDNDHHMKSGMSGCRWICPGKSAIHAEDKTLSTDFIVQGSTIVRRYSFFQIVACILAVNYFSYQVEFDEKEYFENHRQLSNTLSFARPSVNWETFDKYNAPKAFVAEVIDKVPLLIVLPPAVSENGKFYPQYKTTRDKSPPTGL